MPKPYSIATHGLTRNKRRPPEYVAWRNIKLRCYNHNDSRYKNYGARGIEVCERWRTSFVAFYNDMGPRPASGYSLDRINNTGNYEPGNCIWTTRSEQMRNRRTNRWLEHSDGRVLCITDWARALGTTETTVSRRIKSGWTVDDSVTVGLRVRSRRWHPLG